MGNRKIKYSFTDWCRDNGKNYCDYWDYKLNDKKPEEVSCKTNKKYWFKCPRGLHDSELKQINLLTYRGYQLFCIKCRSFGQYLIDMFGDNAIDQYWSDKNTTNPFDITWKSGNKVWMCCINKNHPDYQVIPRDFVNGHMCPLCSNRKVIKHINSLAVTNPELMQYFVNINDAYNYTAKSSKECLVKCPICGTTKIMRIYNLTNYGFICPVCSDGFSYPEKFMYQVLLQIQNVRKFDIEQHYKFEWSKSVFPNIIGDKIYDFVIFYNHTTVIIEVHGEQHFKESFSRINGARTLIEEQENDLFKYNLAIKNNILKENYIIIDARNSDCNWIKQSILNSNLLNILNFTEEDIDWNLCEVNARGNLLTKCSDLWNNGLRSTELIGEKINISKDTVIKYLETANSLGLCVFCRSDLKHLSNKIPLLCVDNNCVYASYDDVIMYNEFHFNNKLSSKGIIETASGRQNSTHGYHFQYITKEEFLRIQRSEPSRAFGKVYFYDADDPTGQNLVL